MTNSWRWAGGWKGGGDTEEISPMLSHYFASKFRCAYTSYIFVYMYIYITYSLMYQILHNGKKRYPGMKIAHLKPAGHIYCILSATYGLALAVQTHRREICKVSGMWLGFKLFPASLCRMFCDFLMKEN